MLPHGRTFARKTIPYIFLLSLGGLAVPACTDNGTGPAEPTAGATVAPPGSLASVARSTVVPGSYIVVFKPEVRDASGDPTGAVEHAYRHAAWLRAELNCPAADEVILLGERLVGRSISQMGHGGVTRGADSLVPDLAERRERWRMRAVQRSKTT